MNEKEFTELLSNAEKDYLEGRLLNAEVKLNELLRKKPFDLKSNELLGLVYLGQNKIESAIKQFEVAAKDKNASIFGLFKLAMLYMQEEAYELAINILLRLHKAEPASLDIVIELANANLIVGNHSEVLQWLLRANKLSPKDKVILYNIGRIYDETRDFLSAIHYYKQSLEIDSKFVQSIINIATIYSFSKDYQSASEYFKKAYELSPNYDYLIGDIIFCMKNQCIWSEEEGYLSELDQRILLNQNAILPFQYLALNDSPSEQLAVAKIYNKKFDDVVVNPLGEKFRAHKKIRIAYVSADFKSHPMAYLMAEIFELHDKKRFEIYAFSLSPLNQDDAMTLRLKTAFHEFYDLSKSTDEQIYELARKKELTIAVDLMGHTTDSRTTVFSKRIAPVQINLLGYPGTMGAKFMDYIVADKNIIPQEQRGFYSENVIFMPNTYQPYDSKKNISNQFKSKFEAGLPENKFIFCCFNSIYKINKQIFSTWIEILDLVPNSILWICTDNMAAIKNLQNLLVETNLNPERLIFLKPQPYATYLEMYKFADLFLDTIPFNAGTTARDALYCGVPVLTIEGRSFAGRMASSLLRAIDMGELIAKDLSDYKNIAVHLATNANDFKAIKVDLSTKKRSKQFCSEDYVSNLESAYEKISQVALINADHSDIYL